ncbi:malto-oligosyltrehalose trehalohydrolase [Spongisporangium articulatum]|uniref:Malto-oligosyltrehalose trehalohydrolase n=1 Tax=Spongisporangium articulatum TaxID=3362603 RepID=A0ABW8ATH9_9ACTN
MHEFSVWAPNAARVMLHLPGTGPEPGNGEQPGDEHHERVVPMDRADGGWWRASVLGAGHGTDYSFTLDGGPPRPDPRSAWQPAGVHGPSRVFDPGWYDWSDAGWAGVAVADGPVFYELHVGTFTPTGTLDSAIDRLGHLVELGVDVVELLPVAGSPGPRGWGYDGVNLYAVHEAYGGPEALQRFVDAAHGHGLAVCLDVVYNHLGPDGNYLRDFGPYFSGKHHTPWGEAVNLDDEGAPAVRAFIVDNAVRWFRDFHVDCLRLDAVHALVDSSPQHILAELSDAVAALSAQLGRPLGLVAESDLNDPATVEATSDGGFGMDAQWADDVHHALHAWLTGETFGYYCDFGSVEVLARVLTGVFRHTGDYSAFRGQTWGHPVDPARHRGHSFVVATQTHDQVGNRAAGDRPSASQSPGRLAAAAALVLTSPFTPMLFMGEEWAASTPWQFFTSFESPELAQAVREGRRAEFAGHGGDWSADDVPDPQDPATRDRSVLDWSEPGTGEHAPLLEWYRALIALRREEPELRDDDLAAVRVDVPDDPAENWVAVHRGRFSVLVNIGPRPATLPCGEGARSRLGFGEVGWEDPGGRSPVTRAGTYLLGPDSVAVVAVPRSDWYMDRDGNFSYEEPHA